MDLNGTVVAVASSTSHGFSKPVRDRIILIEEFGVEGDAHAGKHVRHRYLARKHPTMPNLRQVHLLPAEVFALLRSVGYEILPGELGENVTTSGLALTRLPLGTVIRLGETAAVELTGLRAPCALIDRFRKGLKRQMFENEAGGPKFRCGVLAVVKSGGSVAAGAPASAELPPHPWQPLPPL
jgi:MOSC domain-containing protein YiiM